MSTSRLQRLVSNLLSAHLGKYTIRENIRPEWLINSDGERLELDFYIEELDVAIEVQGIQHYSFVRLFHKSHSNFEKQTERDKFKKEVCASRGIKLVEVFDESDAETFISSIFSSDSERRASTRRSFDMSKAVANNLSRHESKVNRKIYKATKELNSLLDKKSNGKHVNENSIVKLQALLQSYELDLQQYRPALDVIKHKH